MDIDKLLKKVSNLNEYITASQEVANKIQYSKIQLNLSTVLSLKKVRAFEIEYFNKCEGKGAALIIFEHIVNLPPSKTWEFLGKELVYLLQYWLDAMRKHLIKHNHNWWNFMNLLLKFVKLIRLKDQTIPNILVDHTAVCLFDLSTTTEPDVLQRLEILYCLNLCCADASRDIRKTLKEKFEGFFIKLANRLASCSHLPTQFSILETLLRWLLPRHDPAVRHSAAIKWFPEELFGWKAVQIFLERPWQYFFQDARDFLNAFNEKTDLVVSVLCRKILIGSVVVVSSLEKRETWLDVNTIDNSISILLDPKILDALGIATDSWDTLIIAEENIHDIQLNRESSEVTLSLHTAHVPMLLSSGAKVGDGCDLQAVIGTKGIDRLDKVLRCKFALQYKTSLDLDKMSYSMSPVDNMEKKTVLTEEDTRFSHPAENQKRKRSGYMVRSKNPPCNSPSTVSTSSLAHLQEKLTLLPRYKFEKEAVQVCALPNLSTVTEISETDDRQSAISNSTIKITRPYGVCQKNKNKSSQSDSEVQGKPKFGRYLSPIDHHNENFTSCLLVATIGSADESVINDTLERITKSKDYQGDNIVDLLVQEALKNEKDKLLDSGINTGDNKKSQELNPINTGTVNHINIDIKNKQDRNKSCTVISNTTTDESNDVVDDTPLNFVNVRRRQKYVEKEAYKENLNQCPVFDVEVVEKFFTKHLNENNRGEIVISPTLARKINETSSESEQFDDCLMNTDNNILQDIQEIEIQDIEIIECLNSIVDIVCSDFEKCSKILDRDCNEIINIVKDKSSQLLKDTTNIEKSIRQSTDKKHYIDGKPTKGIRLKYSSKKVLKPRVDSKKKNSKPTVDVMSNMSLIGEIEDAEDEAIIRTVTTPESKKCSTTRDSLDMPLTRRKRKLYSPKEENVDVQNLTKLYSDIEEYSEFKTSKTIRKYTATSYKDIEKDRAKHVKRPRTRRSRTKSDRTPSPKTKKLNDMFDTLKDKVESNDSVIFANKKTEKDLAVYNITSDSEDEDFKKKKLELRKRISSTTIVSNDSSMSLRRRRSTTRVNYSENKSSDETIKKNVPKQKKITNRKKQTKINKKEKLIDERMRKQGLDELNTSLIVEKPVAAPQEEPALLLKERPELETIDDEEPVSDVKEFKQTEKKVKKNKKTDALSLRKDKCNIAESEANRTESPLPGLVIETISTNIDEGNDSISINMIQKLKKIYQDGFETSCNNETNTTHNLLSDFERANNSQPQMSENNKLNRIEYYDTLNINDGFENEHEVRCSKLSQSKIMDSVIDIQDTKSLKRQNIKQLERNQTQNNNKETMEALEIPEISEITSDKSIATVGKSPITAHGDSTEAPPNSELLTQKLQPRNLEVEYLDESIKDYYKKLTKEIHDLTSIRAASHDSEVEKSISSVSKSPIVSIAKLSIDDISKWMPLKCNSDTDSSSTVPKPFNKNLDSTENDFDVFRKRTTKLNQIKLKNLNLEGKDNSSEISQRRKSKRLHKSVKYVEPDSEDSDCGDANKPVTLQRKVDSDSKDRENSGETDNEELNVTKFLSRRRTGTKVENIKNKLTSPAKIQESINKSKNDISGSQTQKYRKSVISPIKMFDEIFSSSKLDSPNRTSPNRQLNANNVKFYKNFKDNTFTSSPDSKMSTSTRIIEPKVVRSKNKSIVPEISIVKKIKLDDTGVTSESGPSVTSVNDWFKRNAPESGDPTMSTSIAEPIQHVMEKLDTTLEEIHQNTTKKFIHMYVDAQKELASVRQKRRQEFRTVASEVIKEVVKVIDSKFADLDQRSREMDLEFMEQLKVQASSFIREDCKKKRLMINLLKEDVQTVLDHLEKKNSRRS